MQIKKYMIITADHFGGHRMEDLGLILLLRPRVNHSQLSKMIVNIDLLTLISYDVKVNCYRRIRKEQ